MAAITACSAGDTIYMRGGTYNETDMHIPATKNGTAWTTGNYTTLSSYPGEWAILNGGGTTGMGLHGTDGYDKTTGANATLYWKFERFEMTGYGSPLWFTEGPLWFRYLYIHDNTSDTSVDEPRAGLWINLARENIIEYNYFHHNGKVGGNANYSNIGFDADYRDNDDPTTFDPDHCIRKNIIRYNYIDVDSNTNGIHYKNQQRFGTNTRTSAGVIASYGTWGDDIHHNIITNSTAYAITCDQDNCQVHHNIISGGTEAIGVQFVLEEGRSSAVPRLLNEVSYNNTVIGMIKSFGNGSGCDGASCPDESDGGPTPVPYTWHYNNISDQNQNDAMANAPFVFCADTDDGVYTDLSHVYVTNNLIHSPLDSTAVLQGRAHFHTLAQAQASFSTIAGNWQNTTSGLYRGASGADALTTNGSFVVSGTTTIANGGKGTAHPYLAGVTLPSYVGATNPSDYAWVAGVLALNSSYMTSQTGGSTPTWVEGSTPTSSTAISGGFTFSGGVTFKSQ